MSVSEVSNLSTKTIKFPENKGFDCKSVTLRETCGLDETKAAVLSDAQGPNGSLAIEMVRLSIVKVDGEEVRQPFVQFDKWRTRTRQAVLSVYTEMNALTEDEMSLLEVTSE